MQPENRPPRKPSKGALPRRPHGQGAPTNRPATPPRASGAGSNRVHTSSPPRSESRTPETPNKGKRSSTPRRLRAKNRWFRAILMALMVLAGCFFLALFMLTTASDFFGINQPNHEYLISIPEGADIKTVSELLTQNGVVQSPFAFRTFYSFKEKTPIINPGEYTFNSNMAYNDIIGMLKKISVEKTIIRLPIPEHLSLEEIALLLEENGVVSSAQDFLDHLNKADYNYQFLRKAPLDDPLRYHRYEGYFFPDTYEFYQPERYDSIAMKFLNRFGQVITQDMYALMERHTMTLDETIILASVIQKESAEMKDMVRVSSVFLNRKNSANFTRLQSDVTLQYAENFIKPHQNPVNQEMLDAYNTYVREGLPVGPIGNPGLDAIEAALDPIVTNYYYFVTDINGDFYYAESLAKHNENIQTALKATDEEGNTNVVHGVGTQEAS